MPDDVAFGAGHWMKSPFQANNETVLSRFAFFHVLSMSVCAQLCYVSFVFLCAPICRVVPDSNHEEKTRHLQCDRIA